MKRLIFTVLFGLLSTGAAYAASSSYYIAGDAANGIGGSRHNLGSLGSYTVTDATTEICVFCHTPHHSNSGGGPLWNRKITAAGYTTYGTTAGGTTVDATPNPSTLACLSCHDGVTTFDNLVNAPGKGGVVAGGSAQGWTFSNAGTNIGVSPNIAAVDTRLNIGTDLSNDHPVSVTYNAGVASLRPTNTVISSIDLTTGLAASASSYDVNNLGQNLWDVKGYISNTATIADLLRSGKVECVSCHDPHFSNATGASVNQGFFVGTSATSDGLFLRRIGGNVGSGLCRTCHNK